MVRGIIFDLDGTLVDSLDDIADSVNAALARFGLPPRGRSEVRLMVGNGMGVLAERALPEALRDEARVAAYRAALEAEYEHRCLDRTRPYRGILELLAEAGRRGLALGVLSNKPEPFTRRVVDALFPAGAFSAIRGAGRRFPPKPDPAAALDIASGWGAEPSTLLFVGDSAVDIATGIAAGMRSVAAAWGFRDRGELAAAGPAALIDEPSELLGWLRA